MAHRWSPSLLVFMFAAVLSTSAAESNSVRFVAAEPTYLQDFDSPLIELTMTLPGAKDAEEVVKVRLMQRKDEIIQSFVVPGDHSYVSDASLLKRKEGGWRGEVLLSSSPRGGPARGMGTPSISRRLEVTVSQQKETLTAACTLSGRKVSATARFVSWDDAYDAKNALAPASSWPNWNGPGGSFSNTNANSSNKLVDDLRNARLVWKSQERFGSGKGQSPRYGIIDARTRLPLLPSSGGASPVVYKGNVYVSYLMPSGNAVDEKLVAARRQRAKDQKRLWPAWENELWKIAADDVIACIDGRTGRTLWRTVYRGAGANWHDSKAGPCNTTPCVASGRVYAIGSTGRVYCLDATAGKEIWQGCIGKRHLAIAAAKKTALAEKRYGKLRFNRDFGGAPIVSGRVVVMPDFTSHGACGLLALDAKTGAEAWRIDQAAAEDAVPLAYEHNGQHFVISGTAGRSKDQPGRIVCVESKTGKIRWEIKEGIRANQQTMGIWKNYLLARAPGKGKPPTDKKSDPITMACFEISPAGYKHRWTLPLTYGIWHEHPTATFDGFAYVPLRGGNLLSIEIASGKVIVQAEFASGASGMTILADGRLIVDRDGSHSGTELGYFQIDPKKGILKQLGELWPPPHAHGTSYHPPHSHPYVDGRLLIRGADGVYCYDLREDSRNRARRGD